MKNLGIGNVTDTQIAHTHTHVYSKEIGEKMLAKHKTHRLKFEMIARGRRSFLFIKILLSFIIFFPVHVVMSSTLKLVLKSTKLENNFVLESNIGY